MTDAALYPCFTLPRLKGALADTPVVLIHGPRQCGKTTLARQVGDAAGYTDVSFDDDVTLAAAQADPVGFVADLPTEALPIGTQILFTFYWPEADRWEHQDVTVTVSAARMSRPCMSGGRFSLPATPRRIPQHAPHTMVQRRAAGDA